MAENYQIPNPRVVDHNGTSLIKPSVASGPLRTDTILDREWAKVSFLMSDVSMANTDSQDKIDQATKDDLANRYWSSATRKFTDTQMGGGVAVNNRPQFTPYSDIRIMGRAPGRKQVTKAEHSGNYGMGRYYSEAIDDNAQTVYLRFGVPQYNSLFSFFSNAFDPSIASFVMTGRAQTWAGTLAEAVGTFFTVAAFPVMSLALVGTRFITKFFTRATSKFYSMKPTMYLYWVAVDMLVNAMVVNRGLMPKFLGGGGKTTQRIGDPFRYDDEFITAIHNRFPNIFNEHGRVDIFAVALRAQSTANKMFLTEYEALKSGDAESFVGYIRNDGEQLKETYFVNNQGEHKLTSLLARAAAAVVWLGVPDQAKATTAEASLKVDPATGKPVAGASDDQSNGSESYFDQFKEYLHSEISDGAAFAVFRVDSTGATSESFSNSVMESDISQKINSGSSQARQLNFTFAGGNLGDDPISGAIEGILGGVKDIVSGGLRGLTLGLSSSIDAALSGSYFDIPKTWQSSSASLPRSNYTMQLICPYGHPFSQLQNLYIPLAMLLAGALPRSTGKQTYGPPFLCQIYDRGRCQIQLGMIESLSISRGTSNLSFTNKGQAMAMDVSFTVADLSSIMHMPIGTGSIWDLIKNTLNGNPVAGPHMDEDNILMDYIASITGLDIYNQIYSLPRARLKAAMALVNAQKVSSPAWMSMALHDSATSGVLSQLTLGGSAVLSAALEGASRGSEIIGDRM